MHEQEQEVIDAIVRATRDLQYAIGKALDLGLKVRVEVTEQQDDRGYPLPVIVPSVERAEKLL